MLCWFLLQSNSNQSQLYLYLLLLEPPSPPPPNPSPLGYHRAPGWAPAAGPAASLQLSILHMIVYVDNATFSIRSILSFLHCVHKSILSICISIPSLQIGPSVLFFQKNILIFSLSAFLQLPVLLVSYSRNHCQI